MRHYLVARLIRKIKEPFTLDLPPHQKVQKAMRCPIAFINFREPCGDGLYLTCLTVADCSTLAHFNGAYLVVNGKQTSPTLVMRIALTSNKVIVVSTVPYPGILRVGIYRYNAYNTIVSVGPSKTLVYSRNK